MRCLKVPLHSLLMATIHAISTSAPLTHLHVLSQQDVGWLDVAVHDAVGVEVLEASGDAEEDVEALSHGEFTP